MTGLLDLDWQAESKILEFEIGAILVHVLPFGLGAD